MELNLDAPKKLGIRHPEYNASLEDWNLFRSIWKGGKQFVEDYTKSFNLREDPQEFNIRKSITPSAAHAKSEVYKIKNAISHRLSEVSRKNGTDSYMKAIRGDDFGVDLKGSSMNVFINQKVLEELCPMGKIGIYIDREVLPENATLRETATTRPYLYCYRAEDILAWTEDDSTEPNEFKTVFLRESFPIIDAETGLTSGLETRYRILKKIPEGVEVRFLNKTGVPVDKTNNPSDIVYLLKIRAIPLVIFEISQSLLKDIAQHQIALLNLGSCDVIYGLKANFPFYVEQFDPRTDGVPYKTAVVPQRNDRVDGIVRTTPSTSTGNQIASSEVNTGTVNGRRYPEGMNAPAFIHPSPEPLQVSMEKQDRLIKDIQRILNTTMRNLTANAVEKENTDTEGFESGLHNIGLELEHGERKICEIWAMYEDKQITPTITYPNTYSLKTDEDRQDEAKRLSELRTDVPSTTYQKELAKQMVHILLQDKVEAKVIDKIKDEIDAASTMTSGAEEIAKDMENGLVDAQTASLARGYPDGVVAKAQAEMAKRLEMIAISQSKGMGAARGVSDGGLEKNGKLEKKLSNMDDSGAPVDNTRGKGKENAD